jgi:hypothetical protein
MARGSGRGLDLGLEAHLATGRALARLGEGLQSCLEKAERSVVPGALVHQGRPPMVGTGADVAARAADERLLTVSLQARNRSLTA